MPLLPSAKTDSNQRSSSCPDSSLGPGDAASAWGVNPQIMADLSPGRYFVQVRHYNPTEGTGTYTLKVYR